MKRIWFTVSPLCRGRDLARLRSGCSITSTGNHKQWRAQSDCASRTTILTSVLRPAFASDKWGLSRVTGSLILYPDLPGPDDLVERPPAARRVMSALGQKQTFQRFQPRYLSRDCSTWWSSADRR